jgi:uncharacterized protein DUF5681
MRKKSRRRSENYEVGKGRPPLSTRWKPGQSGNPRGRPKGTKRLATILHEAMQQKIEINEKGRMRRISVWEAIVKTLRNNALKGDFKAITFLLAQEAEIARITEPIPKSTAGMSSQEIANVYLRLVKASRGELK